MGDVIEFIHQQIKHLGDIAGFGADFGVILRLKSPLFTI